MQSEHIVVGDFNLHHPYWCGPFRVTQHATADTLLNLAEEYELNQTLPASTITWARGRLSSTIDLIFMTERLRDCLVRCDIAPKLDQSSDHVPVATRLLLEIEKIPVRKRRLCKEMDRDKLKATFPKKPPPPLRNLDSTQQIDIYVKILTEAIQSAVKASVPWASPSETFKPYWSKECQEAVKNARTVRRAWMERKGAAEWREFGKTCNKKKKVISKAKNMKFRKRIAMATSNM